MEIKILTCNDGLWSNVANYAKHCSWKAGEFLSKKMDSNDFTDWERVFVALVDGDIAGYCTLLKNDCIPNVEYTPYISFIFVGEQYRGNKISEKLCLAAIDYAGLVGFDKVFLVSDHVNLYEKYGFSVVDKKEAHWGAMQTIYRRGVCK